ncbi:MAG: right-handed parallel beta-helix repeat-containing protein [Pseudomonadota bacterium]|nr:right-handed parallel beta-helix repeat-containing protein [Pseudomonadota bacterium]
MAKLNRIHFIRLIMVLTDVLIGMSYAFAAKIYTADPDTYLATLKILEPGAYLQLMPGEYKHGLPIRYLHGTEQAPITISGPDGEPRAVFVARPGHNTVSIVNSRHVAIRNLDLHGRNLPVDGVKCEGHADWAHHITLDGLRIRGHGNNQQTVGISTKCPAWGWIIRNNVIEGAGTGLYLGNSDGRAPFIAGLIEHNLVIDTLGYNLQIKHQQPRPALPGMPGGSSATIIRHNVFSKAHGGSKETARPNMLVGHWPLTGPGANDRYLIYGNFFYQNPHESLFQGEGNIALYNNLLVNHFGDAIGIQPHNDTTREISVFNNTVIAKGSGITLARREHDPMYSQFVTANAVFAKLPIRGASSGRNLTGELDSARKYLTRPFAPLGKMNLMAAGAKMRQYSGESMRFDTYPGADLDFDGVLHGTDRMGAYAFDRERPHWLPALEIKPVPPQ